ncbi:MAG: SPASM domain-containing protein [Promethearchaeota archaeon]
MRPRKLLSYAGLFFQILQNKFGIPRPFSITLDITDACNSKCGICGIWKKSDPRDLDCAVFRDQMKSSRVLRSIKLFNIGGGEPFTRPALLGEVVDITCEHAHPLQVRIATNGLLPGKTVDFFRAVALSHHCSFGVKVSLDGFGEVYERIRGVPGGDSKVGETVEGLVELNRVLPRSRKLDIELGCTVTRENLSQLDALLEYASSKGVGLFVKPAIYGGRFVNEGLLKRESLLSQGEDLHRFLAFNQKLKHYIETRRPLRERVVFRWFYSAMDSYLVERKVKMRCPALRGSFGISPSGDVFPCISRPVSIGNIGDQPFDDIWFGPVANRFREETRAGNCWCLTPCDTIPSLMISRVPFKL